jgi:hypothetical protein
VDEHISANQGAVDNRVDEGDPLFGEPRRGVARRGSIAVPQNSGPEAPPRPIGHLALLPPLRRNSAGCRARVTPSCGSLMRLHAVNAKERRLLTCPALYRHGGPCAIATRTTFTRYAVALFDFAMDHPHLMRLVIVERA